MLESKMLNFLFISRKHFEKKEKEKRIVRLFPLSNCKFSLLAPLLRQPLMLVVSFY